MIRLKAKYGPNCRQIKQFQKIVEVKYQTLPPFPGTLSVWFSFYIDQLDTNGKRIINSAVEYLGDSSNITLDEIDWLYKKHINIRLPKHLYYEIVH